MPTSYGKTHLQVPTVIKIIHVEPGLQVREQVFIANYVSNYVVSIIFIHLRVHFCWFMVFCQQKPRVITDHNSRVFQCRWYLKRLFLNNEERYEFPTSRTECWVSVHTDTKIGMDILPVIATDKNVTLAWTAFVNGCFLFLWTQSLARFM